MRVHPQASHHYSHYFSVLISGAWCPTEAQCAKQAATGSRLHFLLQATRRLAHSIAVTWIALELNWTTEAHEPSTQGTSRFPVVGVSDLIRGKVNSILTDS